MLNPESLYTVISGIVVRGVLKGSNLWMSVCLRDDVRIYILWVSSNRYAWSGLKLAGEQVVYAYPSTYSIHAARSVVCLAREPGGAYERFEHYGVNTLPLSRERYGGNQSE